MCGGSCLRNRPSRMPSGDGGPPAYGSRSYLLGDASGDEPSSTAHLDWRPNAPSPSIVFRGGRFPGERSTAHYELMTNGDHFAGYRWTEGQANAKWTDVGPREIAVTTAAICFRSLPQCPRAGSAIHSRESGKGYSSIGRRAQHLFRDRTGEHCASLPRARLRRLYSVQNSVVGRSCLRGATPTPEGPTNPVRPDVASPLQFHQRTRESIGEAELRRAAIGLSKATRIDLFGCGVSGMIADLIAYRLLRQGCHANSIRDAILAHEISTGLGRDSAAVAVSQSGATPDTVKFLRFARDAGAFTLAITCHQKSPLAKVADETLRMARLKEPRTAVLSPTSREPSSSRRPWR